MNIKGSRTIEAPDESEIILPQYIREAIQKRRVDRELWKN